MRRLLAACMLALMTSAGAPALAVEETADQKFAADAAKDSMAEVQLGQLALNKSDNPQVREFANMMIQDHSKANMQLESIAKSGDVVLPSEPGDKLNKPMNKLSGLSGKDFDRAYMKDMVEDHEHAVMLFERYQREGKDAGLRQFAQQTLPVLQQHLAKAQQIQASLDGR